MIETKSADTVWEFLRSHRLISIATIGADSKYPESAFLYYVFEKPPHIYISTYKDSRKIKNIESNNKVALVLGQEAESIVLQIQGTARVIQETDMKTEMLEKISKVANQNPQATFFPPILTLSENSHIEFIEITIDWFKYSVFETHFPTILEGSPDKWMERSIS